MRIVRMFASSYKTTGRIRSGLIGPMLVLCLCSACAGTSDITDEPAEIPRSDMDAVLRTLSCPDNQKPVCNKRMETVADCYCSSSADFRRLYDVNLKTARPH
jgi:hypothetical protein